jgi:hypothetical protein
MADESSSAAGHRLSEDLRRIREAQGRTVDDVHTETQIARTLIESFEEGALYDHPTYNEVYLRSFVKAYAEVVDLPRAEALEALEAALEGTYDHELATKYLADPEGGEAAAAPPADAEDGPDDAPPEAPTAGGPEGRGGLVGPPRAVGEDPPPEASPDEVADAPPAEPEPDSTETDPDRTDPDRTDSDREEEGSPSVPDDPAAAPPDAETPGDGDAPGAASAPPEEAEADEPPADAEASPPDMTGPEALRSTPDDAASDDAASDDAPAADEDEAPPEWMDDDPDAPAEERASGAPAEADVGAPEGTGIVGEPTEMGERPEGAPADGPSGAPPEPSRSTASDTGGVWARGNRRIYATAAGLALVLIVLVGLAVAYFSSGPAAEPSTDASAPPDTATVAAADTTTSPAPTEPERPPPADVTLGDRIHLTILATGNVSNIRIQRDDDLRRPYWIQEAEASVFPFEDRVLLQNEFADIRVFVEGYPYPFPPADTTGGVEITREAVQSFVDTLRGAPPTLSVSPDTIPVGQPNTP